MQESKRVFPMKFSIFNKNHVNGNNGSNKNDIPVDLHVSNSNCRSLSSINSDKEKLFTSENVFDSSSQVMLKNHDSESVQSFKPSNGTRSRWTKEEEKALIKLVSMAGARGWNQIAALLKTKTAKQCRDHYANCLNPEIKNSLWTVEEERILMIKYQEYGSHWSKIKKFLPGRTTSMIKNYVTMLLKKNEFGLSKQVQNNTNYILQVHDQNDECSSCTINNTSSDNDEASFSLNISDIQEKSSNFDYHNINSILI